MIDYLAALLDGATARELADLGQRETAPARKRPSVRGEREETVSKAGWKDLTVPAGHETAADLQEQGQEWADVPDLAPSEGSVEPEGEENHLYTALRRSVRQIRAVEGGVHVLSVPGEVASGPAADWGQLDRELERDARRYDGGFDLY